MFDVVTFGEVLWDIIDGAGHIGGAPFNLAAHSARCGMRVAIVSAVGAGDAFSAAFLTETLKGKNAVEAAKAGNVRGAWVAPQHGAIPDEG